MQIRQSTSGGLRQVEEKEEIMTVEGGGGGTLHREFVALLCDGSGAQDSEGGVQGGIVWGMFMMPWLLGETRVVLLGRKRRRLSRKRRKRRGRKRRRGLQGHAHA